MNPNPIFSNIYNLEDNNFKKLIKEVLKYKNDIDDYDLLMEINYQLGRNYYEKACAWFRLFKDATWYREDLI